MSVKLHEKSNPLGPVQREGAGARNIIGKKKKAGKNVWI